MYVCLCHAVTDHEIRDAIRRGARTPEDVAATCDGAGTDCEVCLPPIDALLREGGAAPISSRARGGDHAR